MKAMDPKHLLEFLTGHLFDRKRLLYIFMLGVWALFQYRQGNELYAIAIILLYALLSMPRFRNFTLVAACVLVILVFKMPTVETISEIKNTNLKAFQSFKPSLNTILTPNTGLEVLPKGARQMLELVKIHSVPDYRLSDSLLQDPLISQRIIESAWPIKMEITSRYLFLLTPEITNYPACDKIDRRDDIILAYCP